MSGLETLKSQISAIMASVAAAAVEELRRLLDGCSDPAVPEQLHSAPDTGAAGAGVRNQEEADSGSARETQRQSKQDKATNQFMSLMVAWTTDAVERIMVMLELSVSGADVKLPAQQGAVTRDPKKKARKILPKPGRVVRPRIKSRNSLQKRKGGTQEHVDEREEQQAKLPTSAAETESETEPVAAAMEDSVSWSPPEPKSLLPDPTSRLLSSDRAGDVAHDEYSQASASTSRIIRKSSGPFKCPSCDKSFSQKCLMDRHYLTHSKPHLCSECGKRFSGLQGLTAHVRRHTGEKLYKCSECATGFAYKSTFDRHMRQHRLRKPNTQVCSLCEGEFSGMMALQRHRCLALKKTFICSLCPETFLCRQSLADHENLHPGDRDFVCEMCGESFFSSSSLVTHRVTHVQKEKCCDLLGVGCSDLSVLKNHLSKHTGEKLFTCEVCGKGCSHWSALKHHMLTHTGERTYICETCGKRCGHASALQNHMRVHTGRKPGQQPVCEVCGKKFRSTVNLKYHMSIHTGEKPYACDQCEKKFSNPSNLKVHAMIHTGEKMYGCNVCGRRFTQAVSLKLHRQVHTGERPYRCQGCGGGFWNRGNFRKHLQLCEEQGGGQSVS